MVTATSLFSASAVFLALFIAQVSPQQLLQRLVEQLQDRAMIQLQDRATKQLQDSALEQLHDKAMGQLQEERLSEELEKVLFTHGSVLVRWAEATGRVLVAGSVGNFLSTA